MKEKTILKFIEQLKDIKAEGTSIAAYADKHSLCRQTIYNRFKDFQQTCKDSPYYEEVTDLYNSIVNGECENKVAYTEPVDTGNYTEVHYDRDEEGHIVYYNYKIYRKNKNPLVGKLSRDEMNIVYRLYSYYGASLTQREVSRYFPDLSLVDFKRILSAFNIYKASAPFAPHIIEEKTTDELREMQIREKENDFLKKIEEDRIKSNERLLKKYATENEELKSQLSSRENLVKNIFNKTYINTPLNIDRKPNTSDLIVFLSDIHVGAYNESNGYLKIDKYDKVEINRRLNSIVSYIAKQNFNNLIICNLGDSVDSYNKETTRGGHQLPTTLSNKEQSSMYIEVMLNFFNNLKNISVPTKIKYYCIGESNHDGDWGWINNMLLSQKLINLGIESYVSNDPIDSFDIGNTSIVYLHGKDIKNQFKGFPLTLDNKTEDWFLHYFIDSKKEFKERKCVVKGDLHQYAITSSKSFDYISAPSLYGSSNYIVANFGLTRWGCLVMEIDSENNIKNTIIKD